MTSTATLEWNQTADLIPQEGDEVIALTAAGYEVKLYRFGLMVYTTRVATGAVDMVTFDNRAQFAAQYPQWRVDEE